MALAPLLAAAQRLLSDPRFRSASPDDRAEWKDRIWKAIVQDEDPAIVALGAEGQQQFRRELLGEPAPPGVWERATAGVGKALTAPTYGQRLLSHPLWGKTPLPGIADLIERAARLPRSIAEGITEPFAGEPSRGLTTAAVEQALLFGGPMAKAALGGRRMAPLRGGAAPELETVAPPPPEILPPGPPPIATQAPPPTFITPARAAPPTPPQPTWASGATPSRPAHLSGRISAEPEVAGPQWPQAAPTPSVFPPEQENLYRQIAAQRELLRPRPRLDDAPHVGYTAEGTPVVPEGTPPPLQQAVLTATTKTDVPPTAFQYTASGTPADRFVAEQLGSGTPPAEILDRVRRGEVPALTEADVRAALLRSGGQATTAERATRIVDEFLTRPETQALLTRYQRAVAQIGEGAASPKVLAGLEAQRGTIHRELIRLYNKTVPDSQQTSSVTTLLGQRLRQAVTDATAAAPTTDTLTVSPQVWAAAQLPPSTQTTVLPRALRTETQALNSQTINPSQSPDGAFIRHLKIAWGRNAVGLRRKFDFTPEEVVRGIPEGEALIRSLNRAADIERRMSDYLEHTLTDAYRPLLAKGPFGIFGRQNSSAIQRVNRALNGDTTIFRSLTDVERGVYDQARTWFTTTADSMGLAQERRLSDYFPHVRQVVTSKMQVALEIGPDSFLPKQLVEKLPARYRAFMLEPRSLDAPPVDFGMEPMIAYARGAGRSIALNGGRHPATGEVVEGFLKSAPDQLTALPADAPLRLYLRDVINDSIGLPFGALRSERVEAAVSGIRAIQFIRTIGANALSIGLNFTQMGNTLSRAGTSWFLKGFAAMRDPALRQLATNEGIIGPLTKADYELMALTPFRNVLQELTRLGKGFQMSENFVRAQAFASFYPKALAQGMTPAHALEYARDWIGKTQFRYGREGLGIGQREGGIGALPQQFSLYPQNQALFMKDLGVDAGKSTVFLKDLMTDAIAGNTHLLKGDIGQAWEHLAPLARFITFNVGLFGTHMTTLGLDETVAAWLTGDRRTHTKGLPGYFTNGLLPLLGVYIANQVALGTLPLDSYRDLLFWLPGPAAGHLQDILSVGTGLDMRITNYKHFGEPLTPEQKAVALARSLPVAGIFLNRTRAALQASRTPGQQARAPQTGWDAWFGPATGDVLSRHPTEPIKILVGVQTPERTREREAGERQITLLEDFRRASREVNALTAAGKGAEAEAISAAFQRQYGFPVIPSRGGLRSAVEHQALPPLERRALRAPRALRPGLAAEAE